ncbi:MAG: CHAT domain-containing protein [Cyanobacteria bacterium P01_F01_bin.116]
MDSLQRLWRDRFKEIRDIGLIASLVWPIAHLQADAQVVSAQDSIHTQVVQQNNQFDIIGGTLSDDQTLLFHSFGQFDLEPGDIAKFQVVSGVESVFGRIVNGLPSDINGLITVNGAPADLYLTNPAGLIFGPQSTINLAGDFTALTAERLEFDQGYFGILGHPNAAQGNVLKLHFDSDSTGTILNQGNLKVEDNRSLSLIGHSVINQGTIRGGSINIVAVGQYNNVSLTEGIVQFEPNSTAQTTLPPWLTEEGAEHATTVEVADNGTLLLTGSPLSELTVGTSLVGGKLTADDQVHILGEHVATVEATVRGRQVFLGGDYQGREGLPTAQSTFIDAATRVIANGEHGGQVVVWSDRITEFRGFISAQGEASGGTVEISSKGQLYFVGQVDLGSQGIPGTLLLDPENLEIRAGSAPSGTDTSGPDIIYEDTLESSILGTVDLVLQADDDITIAPLSDGALTFAPGQGSVSFLADGDGDGDGSFTMATNNRIVAPGQDITIQAADITLGDLDTRVFSAIDNSQGAGDIRLTATQGSINGGNLTTTARGTLNNNGDGGQAVLSAMDAITVGEITTATAGLSNNGGGGEIVLETQTGTITTENLATGTSGNNNTRAAGDITLTAAGSLSVEEITTTATATTNNSGDGGAVFLTSLTSDVTTSSIATDTRANSSNTGNGGAISLNAPQGKIVSQQITSTTVSPDLAETQGGAVQLNALQDVVVDFINVAGEDQGGNIDVTTQRALRVTGTIPDQDSLTSLLTTGDGTIRLTYNLEPGTPFSLGNADLHGTAGSITTGVETLNAPQRVSQMVNLMTISLNNLFESDPILPIGVSPSVVKAPQASSTLLSPSNDPPGTLLPESLNPSGLEDLNRLRSPQSIVSTSGDSEGAISNSELIWAQIEATFSNDFAKALNLPMPAAPSLEATQRSLRQIGADQGITPALMYIRTKETHIELVLLSGEGPPVYRPVAIAAEELQSVINDFHRTITDPLLRPAQYLPAAQQLFDWFMEPMLEDLETANIDHIGFILDAGLRSLPMAALHDGDRFLIEQYSIGLLPSVGLTDLQVASPLKISPSENATLAMGVADFENYADLAAVPLELELASQRQHDEQYLDQEATLDSLRQRLSQGQFTNVHLATHAIFQPGDLENSYVQLWDQTINLSQLRELPLDTVDFLILSACATALGDRVTEFGFAGLAVNVGVKTVLASLWSISDEGTLGLMSQFYRALEQPIPRSAALRQAQIALLQGNVGIVDGTVYGDGDRIIGHLPSLEASGSWDFSHPAYWSGFTMIGHSW